MTDNSSEKSKEVNVSELIDAVNKIIYDVNLLMEKVKNLEEFKKFADARLLEIHSDAVDLKADDGEIKKNVSVLMKEVKEMEREIIKLSEKVNRLENKTKLL